MSCSFELMLSFVGVQDESFQPIIDAFIASDVLVKNRKFVRSKQGSNVIMGTLDLPKDGNWALLVVEVYLKLKNHEGNLYYNKQGFALIDLSMKQEIGNVYDVHTVGVVQSDDYDICMINIQIKNLQSTKQFNSIAPLPENHDREDMELRKLIEYYNRPILPKFPAAYKIPNVASVFANGSLFPIWEYYQIEDELPALREDVLQKWLHLSQMLTPSGKHWSKIQYASTEHYDFLQQLISVSTVSLFYTDDSIYMPNGKRDRGNVPMLHVDSYDRCTVCRCGDCEDRAKNIMETFYRLQDYAKQNADSDLGKFMKPLTEYTIWSALVGMGDNSGWAHVMNFLIDPSIVNKTNIPPPKHPTLAIDSIFPSLTKFSMPKPMFNRPAPHTPYMDLLNDIKLKLKTENTNTSDKDWPTTKIRVPFVYTPEWDDLIVYRMWSTANRQPNQLKNINSIVPYEENKQTYGTQACKIVLNPEQITFLKVEQNLQDKYTTLLPSYESLSHPFVDDITPSSILNKEIKETVGIGLFVDGPKLKQFVIDQLKGFNVTEEYTDVELPDAKAGTGVWLLRITSNH